MGRCGGKWKLFMLMKVKLVHANESPARNVWKVRKVEWIKRARLHCTQMWRKWKLWMSVKVKVVKEVYVKESHER